MTSAERKALRRFARAIHEVEAAYGDVQKLGLDKVPAVSSMVTKARELAKVNARRQKLTADLREALVDAGIDELGKRDQDWIFAATVGAQVLALLGR